MITNPTKLYYPYQGQNYSALDLIKKLGFKLPMREMSALASRLRYHALKRGIDRAMVIMAKAKPPGSNRAKKGKTKPEVKTKNKAYAEWLRVNPKGKRL